MHCHGGGGSFTTGDADQIAAAAAHHLTQGTTTLVASAVTDSPARMLEAVSRLADACERGIVAGIHVEGPFLAPGRCGAQDPDWLRVPDLGLALDLLDAGRGRVVMMTIAPELTGVAELLDLLDDRGVTTAVGHTGADLGTMCSVLARPRACVVTHLFNGMPPIHHRDPGPALGALLAALEGAATLELIGDGVHVADEMVAGVWSLVGPDRIALVTDAMAGAGLPDGNYHLGPQQVTVRDGVAGLTHCDSIAGGARRLLDIVGRQVRAGLDLVEVVRAATVTPATALGLEDRFGGIVPGRSADLLLADADFTPQRVMRRGKWVM